MPWTGAPYPAHAAAPAGPAPGWSYAGFGPRLGAYILDSLLLSALILTVGALAGGFTSTQTVSESGATGSLYEPNATFFAVGGILVFLYFAGSWWASGHTVGQKLTHVEVVQAQTGARPTGLAAVIRGLWFCLPWLLDAVLAPIGVLAALVAAGGMLLLLADQRRQGWHDKSASTFAITRSR